MSGKPKTVRDAIGWLYQSRDIANRVQSWDAAALELIETKHETQTVEHHALTIYALELEAWVTGCTSDAETVRDLRAAYPAAGAVLDRAEALGIGEAGGGFGDE